MYKKSLHGSKRWAECNCWIYGNYVACKNVVRSNSIGGQVGICGGRRVDRLLFTVGVIPSGKDARNVLLMHKLVHCWRSEDKRKEESIKVIKLIFTVSVICILTWAPRHICYIAAYNLLFGMTQFWEVKSCVVTNG